MSSSTRTWARNLLTRAVELAVTTGSERLIVKTVAESHRIPTVAENVDALELAASVALAQRVPMAAPEEGQVYREARALVDAVLNCDPDIGRALVVAFKRGLLDVPYCVHPDNAGRARSYLDADGRLCWADIGSLPISAVVESGGRRMVTAENLMGALSYVQHTFDANVLESPYSRGELR